MGEAATIIKPAPDQDKLEPVDAITGDEFIA